MEVLNDDHGDRPETLSKEPAVPEIIGQLEERLDCSLPQDYKDFLGTTNDFFYGSGKGTEFGPDSIFGGFKPSAGLHGVAHVHWDDDQLWQMPFVLPTIPREIGKLGDVQEKERISSRAAWKASLPLINRELEIGRRRPQSVWLITPDQVAAAWKAYETIYQRTDDKPKQTIERSIIALAGSREAFDKLEWVCVSLEAGGDATRFIRVSADTLSRGRRPASKGHPTTIRE